MNARNIHVNRHVVDQLADLRARIKDLKKQEAECVNEISDRMGDHDSLGGDQFIARQVITKRKGSVDVKQLEEAGIDADAFRKPETIACSIRLEVRASEMS